MLNDAQERPEPETPRRGRPPRLTRERVAEAALPVIDAEGVEALSMPRLARTLGVGTMTLYGYVRDKDDLLDAVVDRAVRDAEPLEAAGDDWRAAIEAIVVAVHELLQTHPAIVAIRLRQPVVRPEALQFGEFVMGRLIDAGLKPDVAAACFRLIFTYTFGSAALGRRERVTQDRRLASDAIAELDPVSYPALTGNVDAFAHAISGDDQFRFGLGCILDSIESLAFPRDR